MTGSTTAKSDERDGFRFRGGHRVLDLTGTLAKRLSPSPRELLQNPEDLARWLVAARLASILPSPTVTDLCTAKELREAIFDAATAHAAVEPMPKHARDIINRLAAGCAATPQLDAAGDLGLIGSAAALLATLAQEAVWLFGERPRIRQCESATCPLFFVDTSRSGERRWCSMSGCGNKAKVAEHRMRQRGVVAQARRQAKT